MVQSLAGEAGMVAGVVAVAVSVMVTSTRRFCWRPDAVEFVATGKFSPMP